MPRTLLAGVTGLLAAVLLPLSIVSVWVDGVVSDTDTYVETVTPLADDEVVQQAAVRELERAALSAIRTSGAPLPPGTAQLVHLLAERAVASAVFRTAWVQANRTAHEQLIAVLEDRSGARLDSRGRVTIELGTVLASVIEPLVAQGLVDPDRVPDVRASFPVMEAEQLAEARRLYDALDALGFWLPLGWAVLVMLTLLLSHRRFATTARLAVASLLTLGATALALFLARDVVTADLPEPEVAQAVWDVVVASLWRTIAITAGVLAAVTVGAGVAAIVGRDRTPSGSSPDGALAP